MKSNEQIKRELSGKRLLILGGGVFKDALKLIADEYGIVLIAAGNNEFSDMFSIAQEKYYVNSTDDELMKELIIDQKIDGVFMGGSEPVISSACVYLRELGFPCYCTHDQWQMLQDKRYFKELCLQHGLPVVPRYELSESDIEEFDDFPVITKPSDSSGSRGFKVCYDTTDLYDGYYNAKKNSLTGEPIVEQFVGNDAIVVFYTVCNGELYFSGLEDKYSVRYEKQGSYVGGLFVFESPLTQKFREKFETKISDLVSDLGIKQGNFWIEVFLDNGDFYFNEAGFRYGGSVTVYPIDYLYNINQIATDIYYALTGEGLIDGFCSLIPEKYPRGKRYAIYSVFARSGTICEIKGIEEIKNEDNVINIIIRKHIGESVNDSGTFSRVVALVHFLFDSEEELKETIKDIQKNFQIIDQNDQNMVCDMLHIEDIRLR